MQGGLEARGGRVGWEVLGGVLTYDASRAGRDGIDVDRARHVER